jgi:hypothetical protein
MTHLTIIIAISTSAFPLVSWSLSRLSRVKQLKKIISLYDFLLNIAISSILGQIWYFATKYTVKEISIIDWRLDGLLPFLFGFSISLAVLTLISSLPFFLRR